MTHWHFFQIKLLNMEECTFASSYWKHCSIFPMSRKILKSISLITQYLKIILWNSYKTAVAIFLPVCKPTSTKKHHLQIQIVFLIMCCWKDSCAAFYTAQSIHRGVRGFKYNWQQTITITNCSSWGTAALPRSPSCPLLHWLWSSSPQIISPP